MGKIDSKLGRGAEHALLNLFKPVGPCCSFRSRSPSASASLSPTMSPIEET